MADNLSANKTPGTESTRHENPSEAYAKQIATEADERFKQVVKAEEDQQAAEAESRKAAQEKKRKEKERRQKAEVRKRLFMSALGNAIQREQVASAITAEAQKDGTTAQRLLSALEQVDGETEVDYAQLIKSLKQRDLKNALKLLGEARERRESSTVERQQGETEKTPHDGTVEEDSSLLQIASQTEQSLVSVLARLPASALETRYSQRQKRRQELHEQIDQAETPEQKAELQLQLSYLEYEIRKYSEAIIRRNFDNFNFASEVIAKDDDLAMLQALQKEKPELKEILAVVTKTVKTDSVEAAQDLQAMSTSQYLGQLERLRLLIEGNTNVDPVREFMRDRREKLAKRTGEARIRKVEEVIELLPKTELQKLRELAASGESEDLKKYRQALRETFSLDGAESETFLQLKQLIEEENPGERDYLDRLGELLQAESLTEEEQLELYALSSSLSSQTDIVVFLRHLDSADEEALTEVFANIPEQHRQRILQLLDIEVGEELSDKKFAEILREKNTREKILKLAKRDNSEYDIAFAEEVSEVRGLYEAGLFDMIDANRPEAKTSAARLDIIRDIVRTGELDMDKVRFWFAQYGFRTLDITQPEEANALLKRLSERLGVEIDADFSQTPEQIATIAASLPEFKTDDETSALVATALTEAHTSGITGLYAWVDKADSVRERKQRVQIAEALEEELLFPISQEVEDVNNVSRYITSGPEKELYQELMGYMRSQRQRQEWWQQHAEQDGSASESIGNYFYANMLTSSILSRAAVQLDEEQYQSLRDRLLSPLSEVAVSLPPHEYARELDRTLREVSNGANIPENAGEILAEIIERNKQIIAAMENGASDSRDSEKPALEDWQGLFTVENGPGGFYVRVASKEMTQYLLGLDPEEYAEVEGATLKNDNLLEFNTGESENSRIPGSIAVVNAKSEQHELLHLVEENVRQEMALSSGERIEDRPYHTYGLDELTAALTSNDALEILNAHGLNILNLNLNESELRELRDVAETGRDTQISKLNELISENNDRRNAVILTLMTREILQQIENNQGSEEEKRAAAEILIAMIKDHSTDLASATSAIARSFPHYKIAGLTIGDRQKAYMDKLDELVDSEDKHEQAREVISKLLFNRFTNGGQSEKSLGMAIGEELIPTNVELIDLIDRQEARARMETVYQFRTGLYDFSNTSGPQQRYDGIEAQRPQYDRTAEPDPLSFKDTLYTYTDKTYGREMKRSVRMLDTLKKREFDSYFKERPALRITGVPGLDALINRGVLGGMFGLNERDFKSAVNGTRYGKWFLEDQYGFRGSDMAQRHGYGIGSLAGLVGNRAYVEWFRQKRSGLNEKHRYMGHSELAYPDWIRNLTASEKHQAITNVTQNKLSERNVAGPQVLGLMEKLYFTTLNAPPGDRPSFNPEINVKEAGEITDFDMQRASAIAFNLNSRLEEQGGFSNYGQQYDFSIGDEFSSKVFVDRFGNMKFKGPDGELLPLTEEAITGIVGERAMNNNDTFYKELLPDKVHFQGRDHFIHYSPITGESFIAEQEYIDWQNLSQAEINRGVPNVAVTHTDSDGNTRVIRGEEVHPMQKRKYGTIRHRLDMNIAAAGAFNKVMQARERQKHLIENRRDENGEPKNLDWREHEKELYSFADIIRSLQMCQDQYAGPIDGINVRTRKLTKEDSSGKRIGRTVRYIVIPNPDDPKNGEPLAEIDYEVALEMFRRMWVFNQYDNVSRRAYMKGQAEKAINNESLVFSDKIRATLSKYFQLIIDEDMRSYDLKVVDGEVPAGMEDRQIRRVAPNAGNLDDPYFKTREGATRKLEWYKQNHSIAELYAGDNQELMEEVKKTEDLIRKYAYLEEYEKLLYGGRTSIFKDKSPEERTTVRKRIREFITTITGTEEQENSYINKLINDIAVKRGINREEAREIALEKLFTAFPGLTGLEQGRQTVVGGEYPNLFGFVVDQIFEVPGGAAQVGIENGRPIYENVIDVSKINTHITDENGREILLSEINEDLNLNEEQLTELAKRLKFDLSGLYNREDYDGRPIERFISDRPEDDEFAYRLANELMGSSIDADKYKQEMKHYVIKASQMSELMYNEWNRYRRAKYFWESLSKQSRRLNTVLFFSMSAALVLTGSPMAFMLILASMGYAKFGNPYFDVWLAKTVTRRNYAQELRRKARAEANRLIEMYEKGVTLNENMRRDLDDMLLDYELLGESIMSKNFPENYAPPNTFGAENAFDFMFNPQGPIMAALQPAR